MANFLTFTGSALILVGLVFMYLRVFGKENYFSSIDYKQTNVNIVARLFTILLTSGVLPLGLGGLFWIIYFALF